LPLLATTTAATTTAATTPIFEVTTSRKLCLCTYAANVIQIRKLDAAGVTLGVTKINETSDIVIDTTKSMFISPTIVNIEKDATESEVVYTAVTNENKVT
jgi:hypothetical protein